MWEKLYLSYDGYLNKILGKRQTLTRILKIVKFRREAQNLTGVTATSNCPVIWQILQKCQILTGAKNH